MHGYIYRTTNLLNNKVYIGQKKSANFIPMYLGSGKLIGRAIRKYGIKFFKVEFLAEAHNQKSLDILERYYIKVYNATNMSKGYNIATGGSNGNLGVHWSKKIRENMRKAHIGCWDKKPHPCLGTHHSAETKRKIGLKSIGRIVGNKYRLGSHWTNTMRAKIMRPREIRSCICGCGNTFIVKDTDSQKFIKGHGRRGVKANSKTILKLKKAWKHRMPMAHNKMGQFV